VASVLQPIRPAAAPTPTTGERAGLRRDQSLFSLAIDRIRPDADQVRRQNKSAHDDEIQEMAQTIKENGVIEPLNVRYIRDGDYYEIVAGERRYTAAKLAGLDEVPVRIVEADDAQVRRLQLIENVHRADLTPIELGTALQDLIDQGETAASIAKKIHKSASYVTMALTIVHKLTPEAMAEGTTLNMSILYQIALRPVTEQLSAVRAARDGGLNRAQLREAASAARESEPDGPPRRGRPAASRPYARTFNVRNGATVRVSFRKADATAPEVAEALQHALDTLTK